MATGEAARFWYTVKPVVIVLALLAACAGWLFVGIWVIGGKHFYWGLIFSCAPLMGGVVANMASIIRERWNEWTPTK